MSYHHIGFDHAHDKLKRLLREAGIGLADDEAGVRESEIGIVHTRDEEAWNRLVLNSPAGSVRIRTSGGGTLERRLRVTEGSVYEFYLKVKHDAQSFTAADLSYIFEELGNTDVVKAIANGNIPQQLLKYFGSQRIEILFALSILCQGYLAVHADATIKDFSTKHDWEIFNIALNTMKWGEFIESEIAQQVLKPALLGKDPKTRIQLKINSSLGGNYWKPLRNIGEDLELKTNLEWEELNRRINSSMGSGKDWENSKTRKLLKNIINQNENKKDENVLVAEAYLELYEMMNV